MTCAIPPRSSGCQLALLVRRHGCVPHQVWFCQLSRTLLGNHVCSAISIRPRSHLARPRLPVLLTDHPPPLSRFIQAHREGEREPARILISLGGWMNSALGSEDLDRCAKEIHTHAETMHFISASCPPGDYSRVLPLGSTPPPFLLSRRTQRPITTFFPRWRGLAYGLEEGGGGNPHEKGCITPEIEVPSRASLHA